MEPIIEYVGGSGVHSSKATHWRLEKPRPGDLIKWKDGRVGMVESGYDPAGSWAGEGELHVVGECGSAFLHWSTRKREATVSISGGPFTTIRLADLEPEYTVRLASFWNWGDNFPGANQGVHYQIYRPIFNYTGDKS